MVMARGWCRKMMADMLMMMVMATMMTISLGFKRDGVGDGDGFIRIDLELICCARMVDVVAQCGNQ